MLTRKKKSRLPERLHPGDREPERCAPGSIEQQLDMCESGELRGDAIERRAKTEDNPEKNPGADELLDRFEPNLSEPGREGDEMSGDEHSSGLQGEDGIPVSPHGHESEQADQGLPGEETERTASSRSKRRRAPEAA
ncbi:MAG: hypothetical protein NDJ89_12470 [Oligoflexia bacterium]|nr:hypothetical protein [Oligoflexia bacterium]